MASKNLEAKRIKDREYYQANKHKPLGENRGVNWNRKNPDKYQVNSIARVYNVDRESAQELYTRSKQTCDSCGEAWTESYKWARFCIDHDHNTGKVRGILCNGCNAALGYLNENSDKIQKLLDYNERHNG
jgi:hypothetical protein